MRQQPQDAWTRWMDAERAGRTDVADEALRDLLAAVPRIEPSPQLSARLLFLAGRPAPADTSERFVVMGLLVAALGMTLLPAGVLVGLFVLDAGGVVSWVARTCVWLTEWLSAGVSIWSVLSSVGRGLGRVVDSPAGGAALTVTLLVASSALLALNRYLTPERS